MAGISISESTKSEFDEHKPDELTHDEFVQELLDAYRRDNGEVVNIDEIVEQITQKTASHMEIAAYRGTLEALEKSVE